MSLSRIKPTYRPPVPLPALPLLARLLQHGVATKDDFERIDNALAEWFGRFQTALAQNIAVQRPLDCGSASLGITKIQLRRGRAVVWLSSNPLLADGEIGIETDTQRAKIGDGLNTWDDLPYAFP